MAEVEQIDVDEALRLVEGGWILLDVRTPEETEAGRAPGAVLIPLAELDERLEELETDRPLAVICRAGGRSQVAAELLVAKEHTAANIVGGMQAWAEAGLPVVDASGDRGTVA